MSDNNFDKKIAEILNATEVPYEPMTWDGLASKLDQASPAPEKPEAPQFDNIMRSALSNLEPAYNPGHWNMLSQRLDNEGTVRRVRLHKVAEAAIILLVAANFQAFLDGGSRLFRMPVPQEQAAPEVPMAHRTHKNNNRAASSGTIATDIAIPSELAPNTTQQSVFAFNTISTDHNASGMTPTVDGQQFAMPATINSALVDPTGRPIPEGLRPLTLLAALGLDAIEYHHDVPMAGIPYVSTKHRPQKHGYLMATVAMYQQRLKDANGYATRYNATEAGLRAGVRKGKWGVEAGIAYAPQDYTTDTHVFDFYKKDNKTYGVSYDEIRADVVNIPVKVTRQIARVGRNRLHLTAGGTAHIAATKNASFKTIQYPNPPSGQSLADQPAIPAVKGVLEGGSVNSNNYASLDAGLRFEHKISARASAFVEPQYHRYFVGNGFGTEKSKIQAVGVQAGVMAAL